MCNLKNIQIISQLLWLNKNRKDELQTDVYLK